MGSFEVDYENDLCMIIIKYEELYLKELSYYGTSDTHQMFLLISIGHTISKLENNILENYYNPYLNAIKKNIKNPEIYYLQQILFCCLNIVIKMISLWIESEMNSEEFEFKNNYLIGMLENFVDKFICPILPNLSNIVLDNNMFKIECSIDNLKKFVDQNKNKFMSKDKILHLNKLIQLIQQSC